MKVEVKKDNMWKRKSMENKPWMVEKLGIVASAKREPELAIDKSIDTRSSENTTALLLLCFIVYFHFHIHGFIKARPGDL